MNNTNRFNVSSSFWLSSLLFHIHNNSQSKNNEEIKAERKSSKTPTNTTPKPKNLPTTRFLQSNPNFTKKFILDDGNYIKIYEKKVKEKILIEKLVDDIYSSEKTNLNEGDNNEDE